MRLTCLCLFLLLATGSVRAEGDPDAGTTVELDLTADGHLRWRGNNISLKTLGVVLAEEARRHHEKRKRKGQTGWVQIAPGVKASSLDVLIRADGEAPWQHVQWIMTVCAEQRVWRLHFGAKTKQGKPRRVDAFLPTDKGLPDVKGAPAAVRDVRLSVHVIARTLVAARVGGAAVTKPTSFVYRSGERESRDPAVVERWSGELVKQAADLKLAFLGEIKAGHKVPFRLVLDVFERMRKGGLKRIEFYGTQIPGPGLRDKTRLPFPKHSYGREAKPEPDPGGK